MRVGQPGVKRDAWDLDRKANEQQHERPPLQRFPKPHRAREQIGMLPHLLHSQDIERVQLLAALAVFAESAGKDIVRFEPACNGCIISLSSAIRAGLGSHDAGRYELLWIE